tara:strand:- start:117 stop:3767 length:3651 start_codon:yes stop_codon:yes gene_type:complete
MDENLSSSYESDYLEEKYDSLESYDDISLKSAYKSNMEGGDDDDNYNVGKDNNKEGDGDDGDDDNNDSKSTFRKLGKGAGRLGIKGVKTAGKGVERLGERVESILVFFFLNHVKIITAIILIVLIYFIIKNFISYLKKHPRPRVLFSYVDIAGKFDKSTGLDLEMASIASESLTNYITVPNLINNFIDSGLNEINKNIGVTNEEIKTYLNEHLFKNYTHNIDNNTNKVLRELLYKFYLFSDVILADDLNYLKNYYSQIMNIPGGYEQTNEAIAVTTFISEPMTMSVNNKLDNDEEVNRFITELNNDSYSLGDSDFDNNTFNDRGIENVDNIKGFFINILKTVSNDDTNILLKNIFLRNVLYVIVMNNNTDIVNPDSNEPMGNLQRLERNNILSYIDINIDNNNIYTSQNKKLFDTYGKYLHLKNGSSITRFKDIFPENTTNPDIYSKINLNFTNNKGNVINISNTSQIESELKSEIDVILNRNTNNNEKIISIDFNDYDGGTEVNTTYIFDILDSNCIVNNPIKNNNISWYDVYNDYKNKLNSITNYKSDNNKIKEIYNLNEDFQDNVTDEIDDKYNINLVGNEIKSILEIFNSLIIFEEFNEDYNAINNYDELYDKLLEYLYYFEKFTTLTYYNLDGIYTSLLDNSTKIDFLKSYHNAMKKALYFRDSDIINCVCFLNINLNLEGIAGKNPDLTRNKLIELTDYYVSFMEIQLFNNFINDVKEYKTNRTSFDIINDYTKPKIKYIWNDIIIKKVFNNTVNSNNMYNVQISTYKIIREFLGDRCNFIYGKGRDIFNCRKIEDYTENIIENYSEINTEENFGNPFKAIGRALSGPIKAIPKGIAKFLTSTPVFKEIYNICKFIVEIIKFLTKLTLIDLFILFIGLFLYGIATIIKYIFFTTPKGGLATPILMFIAAIFLFVLFLCISSIFIIIIIVIYIVSVIISLLDYLVYMSSPSIKNRFLVSKFLYKYLISCENSPHAWYKNSRYDLENKTSREFFCKKQCLPGYKLSEDKSSCEAIPSYIPYYCPQSLLFRYFREDTIYGKNKILDFDISNYPLLVLKSNYEQKDFINKLKKDKSNYYNSCQNSDSDYYKNYNVIGKNVCAYGNSKKYESENETADIHNKISNICKQTYCENGNYENFCYKYEEDNITLENIININDSNKLTKNIKIILLTFTLSVICIYSVNSMNYYVNKKKIRNPLENIFNFKKNLETVSD